MLVNSTVRRLVVTAATKGSRKSKESQPSWANPDSDEPPPWARNEGGSSSSSSSTSQESFEVPFFANLLASAITAIAVSGSVFEYSSNNPVFGVLESDSIFYTPVLGFFAFTGITTSVFLWFKSVEAANKEAAEKIWLSLKLFCNFYSDWCCSPHTYGDDSAWLKGACFLFRVDFTIYYYP